MKAFVQISASPDVVWGARNVYLGSGLGGMRPNITVLGFLKNKIICQGFLVLKAPFLIFITNR